MRASPRTRRTWCSRICSSCSARARAAGRALGLTLSVVAFSASTSSSSRRIHTFAVAEPLDWLVLARLSRHERGRRAAARPRAERGARRPARADEVDRLAALGAEALNAGRAEDALAAVAEVIRATLRRDACEVYLRDAHDAVTVRRGSGKRASATGATTGRRHRTCAVASRADAGSAGRRRLVAWVATSGRSALERMDGDAARSAPTSRRPAADPLATSTSPSAQTLLAPACACATGPSACCASLARRRSRSTRRSSRFLARAVVLRRARRRARAARRRGGAREALREADATEGRAARVGVARSAHAADDDQGARARDRARRATSAPRSIEEEADRLNRFVADLLDLSRLDGGALAVDAGAERGRRTCSAPRCSACRALLGRRA